jgi:hypothetical protein
MTYDALAVAAQIVTAIVLPMLVKQRFKLPPRVRQAGRWGHQARVDPSPSLFGPVSLPSLAGGPSTGT